MKKILIVEDDPVVGLVYQRFLEKHGFETDLARDGAQGLERLPVFEPDAVLLDLMMPKVGGIVVLSTIRADEAYRHLPVIVLTNACVPAFIQQATKAGANHVLDKSKVTPQSIVELLNTLFETSSRSPLAATN
jgi:CheY-like chemotaxis protein